MESNRYRVAQVIGTEMPPEAREYAEKAMRGNLLRELEGVLFSGETVAVKIEREEEKRWIGGRRVGYTAHIQQVRQVEYTYSAIAQYPKRKKSKKQRIAEKRAALKRNRERKAALRKQVRA